jgi:hypothetical protein
LVTERSTNFILGSNQTTPKALFACLIGMTY